MTPRRVARQIRQMLKSGGSAAHAAGVQWFFKEKIRSHGWRAAALRRAAIDTRQEICESFSGDPRKLTTENTESHRAKPQRQAEPLGIDFLLQVADDLFTGNVLEEKAFAVLLLEKLTDKFGDREFRLFESWLPRISSWADHDGLVHYLIAPMVAAKPARLKSVFHWAKLKDRWHRRAACVALIQGTRQRLFFPEIVRLSNLLLKDEDDMVQKGLGWLLRETAKADAKRTVPYLMKIRGKASRLVLRTACETLRSKERKKVLA